VSPYRDGDLLSVRIVGPLANAKRSASEPVSLAPTLLLFIYINCRSPGVNPAPSIATESVIEFAKRALVPDKLKAKQAKRVHPSPWPVKQLPFIFNKAFHKSSRFRAASSVCCIRQSDAGRVLPTTKRLTSFIADWKDRPSTIQPMPDCTLYTRRGCHLCEEAILTLKRYGLMPQLVDIDADPELRQRYNECVPVVEIDGHERFRGRVNEVLLARLLGSLDAGEA
jgi:glutaredoxin